MHAMNVYAVIFCASLCFLFNTFPAHATDYLTECWRKQVGALRGQLIKCSYREQQNSLYHSPEPWQVRNNVSTGNIWCAAEQFFQVDTVVGAKKAYVSKIQFTPTELLTQYYWNKGLSTITKSKFAEQVFETARYSPVLLLDYFVRHRTSADSTSDANLAMYTLTINGTIVQLFIRTSDSLLEKVTTTQNHDLWGDVTNTILYSDYTHDRQLYYARGVQVEKIRGIRDTITLSTVELVDKAEPLLEKPADYSIADDEKITPQAQVEKMSEHIYFVNLPHAQSRAGLIEFKDFFVVIDAPLSSENGELVLGEARKIAPGKPVKYYAFGHHHPWYIGGVRPFIYRGTTVLCTKENLAYLQFIAEASHTLKPDSLQFRSRALTTKLIDSVETITDGNFEMKIYHIGAKSNHTNDYLLFYFPSEKLVLEGDLAWIPADGTVTKASRPQKGLYQVVKELGLDAKTIVQSWPTEAEYGVKTIFSFEELEKTIHIE